MYSQLGNFIFDGRKTPSAATQSSESNLVEHALIETKPTLQRVGDKLKIVNLGMLFDQSFCNPSEEIASLESSRSLAEILPLIMGDGRYLGEFVIKKVIVTELWSAPDGTTLQADVQVELIEHFDPDRETSQAISAISAGFAMLNNTPPEFTPVIVPVIPAQEAIASVVDSNAASNTAASLMDTISSSASLYRSKADTISQNMLKVGDELNNVLSIIDSDPTSDIYSLTRDLAQSIATMLLLVSDVVLECTSLIADIDNGNTSGIPAHITTLADRSTEVKARSKQVMDTASSLTSYTVAL